MKLPRALAHACLGLVLIAVSGSSVRAQDRNQLDVIPRDLEVKLALSALPPYLRSEATVYGPSTTSPEVKSPVWIHRRLVRTTAHSPVWDGSLGRVIGFGQTSATCFFVVIVMILAPCAAGGAESEVKYSPSSADRGAQAPWAKRPHADPSTPYRESLHE